MRTPKAAINASTRLPIPTRFVILISTRCVGREDNFHDSIGNYTINGSIDGSINGLINGSIGGSIDGSIEGSIVRPVVLDPFQLLCQIMTVVVNAVEAYT